MVGRPKEFDDEEALGRAMEVFWAQGYEATSVQDLLDAMGINRGSMYDTFGDKHALFAAAIDHYARHVTARLEADLDAKGSPLGNIRRVMNSMVEQCGKGRGGGCLATHTAVELAPHDAQVKCAVQNVMGRIEKAFQRALTRAVEAGELPADADVKALARFLNGTLQGLVVMGKTAPKATMKDIVRVALTTLE